jgi:hypothetical protein
MKLYGRRFETVSDIQRESQAVLDSKKDGIATYVPKETILKEMAAKIE